MKIRSYAKVNFTLRVFEKQANNFHNIESLVALINLHDSITIKKHSFKKDIIIFKGKFKKNVNPKKKFDSNHYENTKETRCFKIFL